MLVRDAKEIARQWVSEEGSRIAGFCAAYHAGSAIWLPSGSTIPPTSDVDVMVVISDLDHPARRGKFLYRDVLLDVSYVPSDQLGSPDQVLGDYHLAGAFRRPSIIADPSGRLATLLPVVSTDYPRRRWVRKRCEHAMSRVRENLRSMSATLPLHDRFTAWLFATGITAHVLLAAGLKNPTVRGRYVAVRDLLSEYERPEFHETLLKLLGSAGMSPERVEQHLDRLALAFDAAASVISTPFPFASDITEASRPIAIDGSRDLIERGLHREAVFWIAATYARSQKVLHHDAPPEMTQEFSPGFRQLLGDLGIATSAELQHRSQEVEKFLPVLWEEAEAIMAANHAIED